MPFICFEGIDNSGKTTLSKMLMQHYNGIGPVECNYAWTKEPSFSSEEADRLNLHTADENEREALFLESKIRNQAFVMSQTNLIMDRYIVSGLVYSKVFSPSCYRLLRSIYMGPMFRKPDLHIFVDTDPKICVSRGAEQSIEELQMLRAAYVEEFSRYQGQVLRFPDEGPINEVFNSLKYEIDNILGFRE